MEEQLLISHTSHRQIARRCIMWCNEHRKCTIEQWKTVVWSDEPWYTMRQLIVGCGCDECLVNNMHSSVECWLWNSAAVRSWCGRASPKSELNPLISLCGAVAAQPYTNILTTFTSPAIEVQFGDDHCGFQHNLAPVHTSGIIGERFNDNNVLLMNWFAQSPT